MTTLLRKSRLTAPPEADQKEAISPSLTKRGEGRFYDACIFTCKLIRKYVGAAFYERRLEINK
jgi:hypothetical protein